MYPHASPALIFCCSIPGRLALLLPLTLPYLPRPACLVAQSQPNPTRHFFSTAHQPCCLGPMPTPACHPSCSQLTAAAKPYLYTPNESHCQITTAPNPESRPPSFPLWLPLRRYPPPPPPYCREQLPNCGSLYLVIGRLLSHIAEAPTPLHCSPISAHRQAVCKTLRGHTHSQLAVGVHRLQIMCWEAAGNITQPLSPKTWSCVSASPCRKSPCGWRRAGVPRPPAAPAPRPARA